MSSSPSLSVLALVNCVLPTHTKPTLTCNLFHRHWPKLRLDRRGSILGQPAPRLEAPSRNRSRRDEGAVARAGHATVQKPGPDSGCWELPGSAYEEVINTLFNIHIFSHLLHHSRRSKKRYLRLDLRQLVLSLCRLTTLRSMDHLS
jgi:hypothetical protein